MFDVKGRVVNPDFVVYVRKQAVDGRRLGIGIKYTDGVYDVHTFETQTLRDRAYNSIANSVDFVENDNWLVNPSKIVELKKKRTAKGRVGIMATFASGEEKIWEFGSQDERDDAFVEFSDSIR